MAIFAFMALAAERGSLHPHRNRTLLELQLETHHSVQGPHCLHSLQGLPSLWRGRLPGLHDLRDLPDLHDLRVRNRHDGADRWLRDGGGREGATAVCSNGCIVVWLRDGGGLRGCTRSQEATALHVLRCQR